MFITIEEYKGFEKINSTENDIQIEYLVQGVNSLVGTILGTSDLTDYINKPTTAPITNLLLDTDAKAQDIEVTDSLGQPLEGLSGGKGFYEFTNYDYIGEINFIFPNPFLIVPSDLKLACLMLVRYYRSNEYKASVSGAGQSVAYVSLTSNIPRHIMSVIALYRRL